LARAPVSKTGGWGFETLHPCQLAGPVRGHPHADPDWRSSRDLINVAFQPVKFVREVRTEVSRVTWPSRKETLVTTGLVFAMAAAAAIFFFVVDQVIGLGVRALFNVGI
jgi:preprotein translocase subunit SecE